jgi:hypothetical protein
MISNMSRLTAYNVGDLQRPWGKIHDFLVEFPSGKSRYFSVDAHVGVGVKEIWAPMETLARVDPEHMAVTVQAKIDSAMIRHLSRLETPERDTDELKLHRLYRTAPDWLPIRREKGGPLRKQSRLIRGGDLIGFEINTRNGNHGRVCDLLFDDKSLGLMMLRLQFDGLPHGVMVDIDSHEQCRLYPEAHALYINVD